MYEFSCSQIVNVGEDFYNCVTSTNSREFSKCGSHENVLLTSIKANKLIGQWSVCCSLKPVFALKPEPKLPKAPWLPEPQPARTLRQGRSWPKQDFSDRLLCLMRSLQALLKLL